MNEAERTALAEEVARGDQDALQRLIVVYHVALRRAVDTRIEADLRRYLEPDDVLQQAYVSAVKAVGDQRRNRKGADTPSHGHERAENQNRDRKGADSPRHERERAPAPKRAQPGTAVLQFDSPAVFYKWLEAIAICRLKDQERALRRRKRDIARVVHDRADFTTSFPDLIDRIAGSDSTPSRRIGKDEAIAAVMSCLARLTNDQREVVRLRFLEGKSVAEVAGALGKTEANIHVLCHRGLKRLRELMVSITRYLTHL